MLIGETRGRPTGERAPINIDKGVRTQLIALLYQLPEMRGVGFSEFIMRAVDQARREIKTAAGRPAFPDKGVCSCGCEDWYDCETGYTRMSSASVKDGVFRVFMDGWDDMSEGGNEQHVACAGCGKEYEYPTTPMEYE